MDVSFLWTLGIMVLVIVFTFGVLYLKKKGLVSSDNIKTIADMLGLSLAMVEELKIKNEPQIKEIGQVVLTALNSAINVYNAKGKDAIIANAIDLAFKTCEQENIQLTNNRKMIIEKLIELGFNNKYGDKLTK